jgi:sugar phosphate isomerase/epimerase
MEAVFLSNNVIGVSNVIFGKRKPMEDDFRQFSNAGIQNVELRLNPDWLDIKDRDLVDKTINWIQKYGINVHSIHGPCGFPGKSVVYGTSGFEDWLANPEDSERRGAVNMRKEYMKVAQEMGAKYFIVEYECYNQWPFWPHRSVAETRYYQSGELWKSSVEELIDYAIGIGIKLAIENIDGLSCTDMLEAVKKWPSDVVGVCFDTSHASYDIDNFFINLTALSPYMVATHLSDNDALEGIKWRDRHWMPFTGSLDWNMIMKVLLESGYSGCLLFEVCNNEQQNLSKLLPYIQKVVELY